MSKETQAENTHLGAMPADEPIEVSIERKLVALFTLQQIHSQIDRIRIIRGELPLEVQDLEDEIAGLETRMENYENEVNALNQEIEKEKISIKDSQVLIKRYDEQLMNVRNNREYEALLKEIDNKNLDVQLSEKRIREATNKITTDQQEIESAKAYLTERIGDLEIKKSELRPIVEETEKEEEELHLKAKESENQIEDRLIVAYNRIRQNARNGLAVVQVQRDACGGCFNKIPPQHQLDIRMHKKVIVCEYCGRILVDSDIVAKYK